MGERRARVTAAYATVAVLDPAAGKPTVYGFHEGAIFPPSSDPVAVERLVRRGYAEWVDEPEPDESESESTPDESDEPKRPHGNAGKAAWVDYAVARRDEGVSEEDARAVAEQMTKEDLVAELGQK